MGKENFEEIKLSQEKNKKKILTISPLIAGLFFSTKGIEAKKLEDTTKELEPKNKIEFRLQEEENKEVKKEQISLKEVYKNPKKFSVVFNEKFDDNFNNPDTRNIFGIQSFVVDKNSGKIFLTDRKNTGYFYDSEGNLDKDKIIDKRGRGPGDLHYPVIEGISGNRLIVRNAHSLKQVRIEFFDFRGNSEKSLLLNGIISSLSILGENIFYISNSFKEKGVINQDFVKFSNGKYETIYSFSDINLEVYRKGRELPFHFIKNKYCFAGRRFLVSNENFAILSHSEDNFIQVINKEGEIFKINVFSEKDKEKISKEKHAHLIEEKERECQEEINVIRYKKLFKGRENEMKDAQEQALEKIRENQREHLPYFNEIIIDSPQENILFVSRDKRKVFAFELSKNKKSISKLGEFDDKTELGKKILSSESKVALNNGSIFGFFEEKDEKDEKSFQRFDIKKKY